MGRPRKQKIVAEKAPCVGKSCSEHLFVVTALDLEKKNKFDVKLEFCPKLSKYILQRLSLSKKYESIYPKLNADGKIYTPCFILEGDAAHYRENDEKYQTNHQLKLEEYLRSKKQLFEPKHARKSLTCAVCRIQYIDYRDHIHSEAHKIKIRQNPYNQFIKDLINTCDLEHMMDTAQSETDETFGRGNSQISDRLSAKPKRMRKAEKIASKEIQFQQHASIFTTAYTRQMGRAEQEPKTLQLGLRSFHVEDYLVL